MTDDRLTALGLRPGDRVLDIGFRAIDALRAFQGAVGPDGHVTGVDLDSSAVSSACETIREQAWSGLHAVEGSVTNLPFEDGSFDLVLCRGVLHEVRNVGRALDEIARAMTLDGRLTIVDFTRFSRMQFARYRFGHRLLKTPCLDVRPGFRRKQLCRLLKRHGFREAHYEVLDSPWRMGFIQCPTFLQRADRVLSP